MFTDGLDIDSLLNSEEMIEERKRYFRNRAYIQGVIQGFTKKYSGCIYTGYESVYSDGIIVGMGMTLFQYLKFRWVNRDK